MYFIFSTQISHTLDIVTIYHEKQFVYNINKYKVLIPFIEELGGPAVSALWRVVRKLSNVG
jgi:hypothetical protein